MTTIDQTTQADTVLGLRQALWLMLWVCLLFTLIAGSYAFLVHGILFHMTYLAGAVSGGTSVAALVLTARRRLMAAILVLNIGFNLLSLFLSVMTPLAIPVIMLYPPMLFVISAVFVRLRMLAWLTVCSQCIVAVATQLWLTRYVEQPVLFELVALFGVLATQSLAILLIWQANRRERQLVVQLQASHDALQQSNSQLEQKATDRTIELANTVSLLRATLESTADGLLVVDSARTVTAANQKFYSLWRIPPHLINHMQGRELLLSIADQLRDPDQFYARVAEFNQSSATGLDLIELSDGRVFERYTQPQWVDQQQVGRVWSFRDVSEHARARRHIQLMVQLGQRLSAATDVNGSARIILDVADELLHWDSCYLDLYDEATQMLDTIVCIDTIDGRRQETPPPVIAEAGPLENQILYQGPLLLLRQQDEHQVPLVSFGDTARKSESLMFVPIRRGLRVVGVLSIQSYTPNAYTQADVQMLQGLADHCGAALERIYSESMLRRLEAEQQEFERKLLETQKLESLGVLAGGIAHDFNNLLAVVFGNLNLAQLELAENHPATVSLHQVERAATRAAELTRQMLAYAGKGHLALQQVELNTLVADIESLLRASLPKHIEIVQDFMPNLPIVQGDAIQIQQVAMNLLVNATEAIGEQAGTVRVRTSVIDFQPHDLHDLVVGVNLSPGQYVVLEVSDNGCGMDSATLRRIFEPFFTTKFTGRGLGLASAMGIARSHRGAILVQSELGTGTRFQLLLPPTAPPAPPNPSEVPQARQFSQGVVLVIDDEPEICDLVRRVLRRIGFEAITATDGPQGIALFREPPAPLAFVLLDLTMPHMSGQRVYNELQALNAAVPIVLMSGYTEQDARRYLGDNQMAGFIHKPFRIDELRVVIQKVLDGTHAV